MIPGRCCLDHNIPCEGKLPWRRGELGEEMGSSGIEQGYSSGFLNVLGL